MVSTASMTISESSERCETNVLGPFSIAVKFSGFDLTHRRGHRFEKYMCIGISALIFILMFAKLVTLLIAKSGPTLSIFWLDNILWISMTLYSLACAVCIMIWTWTNFISRFEDRLSKISANRIKPPIDDDHRRKHFVKTFFFCAFLAVTWILTVLRGALYSIVPKNLNTTIPFRLSIANLYGGDYVVIVFIIMTSCVATSVFVLVNGAIVGEFAKFNRELKAAANSSSLTILEELNMYSKQSYELLCLVKFANHYLTYLVGIAPICAMFAFLTVSLAFTSDYRAQMNVLYGVVIVLWAKTSGSIMYCLLYVPGRVQKQIRHTMNILLEDPGLQTTNDDALRSTYRFMIERCQNTESQLCVVQSIPVDQRLFQKVMLTAGMAVNLGALMKTYYDQGHPRTEQISLDSLTL